MTATRSTLTDGATFTHQGLTFKVRIQRDEDMREPWKEHDGHGIVSDWTTRPKAPGERILATAGNQHQYYDVRASTQLALKDGWGSTGDEGLTRKQKAARAVQADFDQLQAWCNDEWEWLYVSVTLQAPPLVGQRASVGGIDGYDAQYCTDTAYELAEEIIAGLPKELDRAETAIRALRAQAQP